MALALRRGMGQNAVQPTSHPAPATLRKQLNANSLAQFVDPLPVPETIQPIAHRPSPDNPAVPLPFIASRCASLRRRCIAI